MFDIRIVSFIVIVVFIIVIFMSVKNKILDVKYSLIWIITSLILGILSLHKNILEWLAYLVGVEYAPSVLFLFGLVSSLILIFDLTIKISKLSNMLTVVTQELAILKQKNSN